MGEPTPVVVHAVPERMETGKRLVATQGTGVRRASATGLIPHNDVVEAEACLSVNNQLSFAFAFDVSCEQVRGRYCAQGQLVDAGAFHAHVSNPLLENKPCRACVGQTFFVYAAARPGRLPAQGLRSLCMGSREVTSGRSSRCCSPYFFFPCSVLAVVSPILLRIIDFLLTAQWT